MTSSVADATQVAKGASIADRRARQAFAARLASARQRLGSKLAGVDLGTLGLSAYNQRYLSHKLSVLDCELRQVGDLLTLCLADSPIVLDDFVLLDYGGGSGMISLLARELGVGTVVYNDIYDVSCEDVSRLSAAIGLSFAHIVCGDIDAVVDYTRSRGLRLNGIVSYDVLEHIYDVSAFFRALAGVPMSSDYLRLVYASGANIKNPRYVHWATAVQRRDELEGTEPVWGHKERDSVRPFLSIRRELIHSAAPTLSVEEVEQLATATRGLRQDDIEKAVGEYLERGSISYRPNHATNTCDPLTGNWSEHLMEPSWIEDVVRGSGFDVSIRPGRYASGGSRLRTGAKHLANVAIRVLGRRGLIIAPYYVVYGTASVGNGR